MSLLTTSGCRKRHCRDFRRSGRRADRKRRRAGNACRSVVKRNTEQTTTGLYRLYNSILYSIQRYPCEVREVIRCPRRRARAGSVPKWRARETSSRRQETSGRERDGGRASRRQRHLRCVGRLWRRRRPRLLDFCLRSAGSASCPRPRGPHCQKSSHSTPDRHGAARGCHSSLSGQAWKHLNKVEEKVVAVSRNTRRLTQTAHTTISYFTLNFYTWHLRARIYFEVFCCDLV